MELHKREKHVKKPTRRLGRGHGSGRVKTSGRGTKGQKARGKIAPGFEGGQLRLLKRLPFNRGKNRNDSYNVKPIVINVGALEVLKTGTVVTIDELFKNKLIPKLALKIGVKLLGSGTLTKKLTVNIPCSKGARKLIEKAGGTVELITKEEKS